MVIDILIHPLLTFVHSWRNRSICDDDGPEIADEFYGHLFREDSSFVDTTEAARALHLAVNKLRIKFDNGSFARWVPFVHYGL